VSESRQLICVGSYTPEKGGKGVGISTFWRDTDTGALTETGQLALASPSWLTWHPSLPVLYAANETAEGAVTAVSVSESGELRALGSLATGGADPCHLSVTPDSRHLLCANYSGGNLAVFSLDADGSLGERTDLVAHHGSGPNTDRQEAAHVHMAVVSADGSIVSAVDLGTDEIRSYTLSPDGKLTPLAVSAVPPGTGPRQLVRRPGTDYAYVVGELAGTVLTVREEPPGTFTVEDVTSATKSTAVRSLPAHLEIYGDALYVSNRDAANCVTAFEFDGPFPRAVTDHPANGWPRHFTVLDGHCYVACPMDNELLHFALTPGAPVERVPTGMPVFILPRPV
jgi:6-phosphogluconolactonase (cycloisomerase 2 family)